MEINIDSLLVLKAMEAREVGRVECVSIIRKIMHIMSLTKIVVISHIYKNVNPSANYLANIECTKKRLMYYNKMSDLLILLLEWDVYEIINSIIIVFSF